MLQSSAARSGLGLAGSAPLASGSTSVASRRAGVAAAAGPALLLRWRRASAPSLLRRASVAPGPSAAGDARAGLLLGLSRRRRRSELGVAGQQASPRLPAWRGSTRLRAFVGAQRECGSGRGCKPTSLESGSGGDGCRATHQVSRWPDPATHGPVFAVKRRWLPQRRGVHLCCCLGSW